MLHGEGFTEVVLARSVDEALRHMKTAPGVTSSEVDLILMDIHMPGTDGLQACRDLKAHPQYQDIPVIIISGAEHLESLRSAFDAGAMDFLRKPPERIELVARVRSALRLKAETDRRKSRELELIDLTAQLETVNRELKRLSSLDGLTGIANRHVFNEFYEREWKRAARHGHPLAVVLADIDCFKGYNDTYGHIEGDECLKRVAEALKGVIRRGEDLVARYGGEEFVAVLPGADLAGAALVAEAMRASVERLSIPHSNSTAAPWVTASLGVATLIPGTYFSSEMLVEMADKALYRAKHEGRNRVALFSPDK